MLWASNLYAEETCFSDNQVDTIIIRLERGDICEKQLLKYDEAIQERDAKIKAMDVKVDLLTQKIDALISKIEVDKKIADETDKARLSQIEELKKPNWGTMIKSYGAGVLTGIIIILLL
jgi:hypothetical protein